MEIVIQPRLQNETWSLYWKESMKTNTVCLENLKLTVDPTTTVEGVLKVVEENLKWRPTDTIPKLEGFKGPWERVLHKGRLLKFDSTLAAAGIQPGSPLTVVRVQLLAEGWKVSFEVEGQHMGGS
jgi:hypothetical protein